MNCEEKNGKITGHGSSSHDSKSNQISEIASGIKKGLEYLEGSCRPITGFQTDSIGGSRTSLTDGYFPEEIYTSLHALDVLGESLSDKTKAILRAFVTPNQYGFGSVNFFKYQQLVPDDVEDTALYHWLLLRDGLIENDRRILDVSRLIFLNRHSNGVIEIYLSPKDEARNFRLCAGALSNIMRFLYSIGADKEASKSEDYIFDWLVSEKYLKGSRYYPSPDTFLYFCSRAVTENERPLAKFKDHLIQAIQNRFEKDVSSELPLDLAFRVLSLGALGQLNSAQFKGNVQEAVEMLKPQQDNRGAWPKDAVYKKGRTETYLGGDVLSTIFAVAALQAYKKSLDNSEPEGLIK